MSNIELIGICGASSSGKSTLALELRERWPERVAVVHFDDFQKPNETIENELGSVSNWDDPRVTDFDEAYAKLAQLKNGQPITVQVKNEFDNPDFIRNVFVRFSKTIQPRPLIIVEGHYTLYSPDIRSLFDVAIFLDNDLLESTKRRTKGTDTTYNETYLLPMFRKHIAPTAEFADMVIDVNSLEKSEVAQIVGNMLIGRLSHGSE